MSPGIYLVGDDGKLVQMDERDHPSEDDLQTLLEAHPQLLVGDQMPGDEPHRPRPRDDWRCSDGGRRA